MKNRMKTDLSTLRAMSLPQLVAYLAVVGGAASLQTTQIEEIEEVYWEDLMPECLWQIRYKGLGPLTVAIDAHGNNRYGDVISEVEGRRQKLYEALGISGN